MQRQRRRTAAVTDEDSSSTGNSYIAVDDALPVRKLAFFLALRVVLVAM